MSALTVAPLYCLVAARWGRGAATEPELANWAEVKPRGPEGFGVGCKVNPETREASTSREEEEEEMVRWEVDIVVVIVASGREEAKWPTASNREEQPAPAPLSLVSSHLTLFYLTLYISISPFLTHPLLYRCHGWFVFQPDVCRIVL